MLSYRQKLDFPKLFDFKYVIVFTDFKNKFMNSKPTNSICQKYKNQVIYHFSFVKNYT